MKKILFVSVFLILINVNIGECADRTVTTITPLQPPLGFGGNFQNYQNYQYDSYPKITQIEGAIFNRTFPNEDIYNRLSRIEAKMFNRTNPNLNLAQRVEIITQNINPSPTCNIPQNNLAQIEYKLFNRSYINDDIETRIIRLEKEMLGAMQPGELEDRYAVVASAAKHYNAFPPDINQQYQQPYRQVYNQPTIASSNVGGKKGILQNVLSTLAGGALTGFTPSLTDPYGGYCSVPQANPYPQNNWSQNPFTGSSSGFNNAMQSNNGYYNYSKNYGTGTGAHILYD